MDSAAAQAPISVETISSKDSNVVTGRDPMTIRWGINCVVREKNLDATNAGFPQLPFARFFAISRFTLPMEIHTVDENMAREQLVTKTAQSVEDYLNEMLAGYDNSGLKHDNRPDFGFRTTYYGELDAAKVAVVSATLLPSLTSIRQIAANLGVQSPISAQCEGHENFDVGGRETCPTCWSKWIVSDACDKYIAQTAENGRTVQEFDGARALGGRTVHVSHEDLETGRTVIIESLRAGLKSQTQEWFVIAQELERNERKAASLYQHGIRRDIHAPKPSDREINMIREYGAAQQGGNAGGGNNDALLQMLAQGQMQTQQILAQMLANQGGTPVAAQAPIPVADPIAITPVAAVVDTATGTPDVPASPLSPAAQKMEAAKNKTKKE